MKFEYLREFVVAAQSSEMQHAAAKLGISVSSLSKHIKAIETELGVPLFVRARRTALSQYGKLMLPYAKELVALQDDYIATFQGNADNEQRLVIGLSPIQFKERSGALIEQFMLENPSIQIRTAEYGNSELCRHVKNGDCDMAFVRTQPEILRDPELMYYPFGVDKLVAFMNPHHNLAREESLTFSQLKYENIILRSENSTISRVLRREAEKAGYEPHITYTGSFSSYDMVRRGEGITLYLAPPVTPELSSVMSVIPIEPPVYSFIDIVIRRGPLSGAADTFFRYVQEKTIAGNMKPQE